MLLHMSHAAEHPHTSAKHAEDTRPAALWEAARHWLDCAIALFGGPVALVAEGFLTPRARAEFYDWLRPIEALARRLLVILAAEMRLAPVAARPPRARVRKRRLIAQDKDDSTRWRVAFQISARAAAPRSRTDKARTQTIRRDEFDCWPAAERLEALIRVIADPAPVARRLARRLAARPDKARALARPPKRRQMMGDWAVQAAADQALREAAWFDSG